MEFLSPELIMQLVKEGPFVLTTVFFLGLYWWSERQRRAERTELEARLAVCQKELLETVKLLYPLVQKFTDTMEVVTPALLSANQQREGLEAVKTILHRVQEIAHTVETVKANLPYPSEFTSGRRR